MSDDEAIEQAWQVLRKIPFLEGEYCCTGVRETFVEIDSQGEHVECAGVGFSRVLDGMPVSGARQYRDQLRWRWPDGNQDEAVSLRKVRHDGYNARYGS